MPYTTPTKNDIISSGVIADPKNHHHQSCWWSFLFNAVEIKKTAGLGFTFFTSPAQQLNSQA